MQAGNMHGVPVWVDLSARDVEMAARFYGELLGWSIARHDAPMGDYYIGSVGGRDIGGMMAAPATEPDTEAAWTVLFDVGDVDATTKAVEEAGGTTLEQPFDLPDSRLAIVADPAGAVFGVASGPQPDGSWLSSAAGAVCWVELLTRDPETAINFYTGIFGWDASTETIGDVRCTTFALDGVNVGGAMMMPDEVPAELTAIWTVYFAVDDCDSAALRAQELGARVVKPTASAGGGRFTILEDPHGVTFQLMDQQG